ncbi:MAG: hypothetical protein APR53_04095 [Methanoculleus sp. SDB]|nr:MAG: hypothetical protein APR53_04095 [Methanoculleus sp. SDB]
MKRCLVLLILLGALFLCAACTDTGPAEPTPAPTASPSPVPPDTMPADTAAPGTTPPPGSAVPWVADGIIGESEYDNSVTYSNGKMTIYWTNDPDVLYMALRGEATGWVSIGFEPTTAMMDADMLFGYVEDGNAIVFDMNSTGPVGPHPPDTDLGGTSDILASGGSESDGITIIEFSRLLNTGDTYDRTLISGQTVKFIWGIGTTDSATFRHNVARGSGELVLA